MARRCLKLAKVRQNIVSEDTNGEIKVRCSGDLNISTKTAREEDFQVLVALTA
jgi:hypothetical protein